MKFDCKQVNIFGKLLQIPLPDSVLTAAETLLQAIKDGKEVTVEIKVKRKHRSLDANAFLWQVLSDMAARLHTSKDELYLMMLERYGVFAHYIVHPGAVDRVKREFKTVRVLGEVTVNGKTGVQVQVYYGSSNYNTKEFSVLLDGVLSEAKDIGLEYISEADKALMLEERGNKYERNRQTGAQRRHLLYPSYAGHVCSVIQGYGTYGGNQNLLEIFGLTGTDNDVEGWLSAAEVFGRIKKHWEEKAV